MQQSAMNVRVPDELKKKATAALTEMGLSPSSAVRLFLSQVVKQKRIPFEIVSEGEERTDIQSKRME
jgi:DNA-damage-inducible protein J